MNLFKLIKAFFKPSKTETILIYIFIPTGKDMPVTYCEDETILRDFALKYGWSGRVEPKRLSIWAYRHFQLTTFRVMLEEKGNNLYWLK